MQGRFESSRLFGPTVGLVASSLLTGFLVIVASSGALPWALVAVPALAATGLALAGLLLARRMPPLPGYGRIDLWLLSVCLAGALLLSGVLLALQLRASA